MMTHETVPGCFRAGESRFLAAVFVASSVDVEEGLLDIAR